MTIPPPVGDGAMIGVVAPAGAVDPAALDRGLEALHRLGFSTRVGASVLSRRRYCAGEPAARAADLTTMFRDPDVAAVICARGGYGSAQVLPLLERDVFTAHPKLLCGYSDVSPLLGFLVDQCNLVALHGPMVAVDFAKGLTPRTAHRLRALLRAPGAVWRESVCAAIAPGVAAGRVVGGCLSSLIALLGTPYAVQTDGAVLFLEDVAERPYRIDRMLTQLRLAGKLDRIAAVILGSFVNCDGRDADDVVSAVFEEFFADAPFPVVGGFPAGHLSDNLPLALGLPVRVDADNLTVESLAA